MELFSGTATDFIQKAKTGEIALILKREFFNAYGFNPTDSEYMSWHNSLRAVKDVFVDCGLSNQGVVLEYQLPASSRRLDCMVSGLNDNNKPNAVIIELKQWMKTEKCDGEFEVITKVGGEEKELLHPSKQVERYKSYLKNYYSIFQEKEAVELFSCAYLHNYKFENDDALLDPKFNKIISESPVFSLDDFEKIRNFIFDKVGHGEGMTILKKIEASKKYPNTKLMDNVADIIHNNKDYILLDEQQIVYDKVFACIEESIKSDRKHVLIIKGGPGTGKSVIAMNLLADLQSKHYWTEYVTGSKAFTQTCRRKIGFYSDESEFFKYTDSYRVDRDMRHVLIIDEAHRLRETSNSRYTKANERSDIPQVEEIIDACKVAVFFIDDKQLVRPNEIGSSQYIVRAAENKGCVIWQTQLEAQFRCSGSDSFVNWLNNTLGLQRTANALYEENADFDFEICSSPQEMENRLREKLNEGFSARIVAGFCWPWTEYLIDGKLANDVKIQEYNYERPWNASEKCTRLPRDIPKQAYWAEYPGGFNQIGCIYTAQGFEFDYVGVIVGKDIIWNPDTCKWEGHPENCKDGSVRRSGNQYLDLIKNTYRVLMSRGLKGCYLFFLDKNTERYFKSRINKNPQA